MAELIAGDLYAGLSGLDLGIDSFDLGGGVSLNQTYAHLMSPFIMAFKPAPVGGGHHPAPWKAVRGSQGFDVTSELHVPLAVAKTDHERFAIARIIVFLVRIGINPATSLVVVSSHSFADVPTLQENEAALVPFEVQKRRFPLSVASGAANTNNLEWVRKRWRLTHAMAANSEEFALAVEALDTGQFIEHTALALVSTWAALEALFSPSTTELKFRVSSLIAAFLEPPGIQRAALQKEIAALYDKRSAAAHGKSKHDDQDLIASFNLLRRVVIAMIDREAVPSKAELEAFLFGATV
jgi:hypothetical protein